MSKIQNHRQEGHFRGAGYNDPPEDHGHGGWGGGGVACGVAVAGGSGRSEQLDRRVSEALAGVRRPRAVHDPGRVLVDLAAAVADGAEAISDIAMLADQGELFGDVASDSTCWRTLNEIGPAGLAAVDRARAAARELLWARRLLGLIRCQARPQATDPGAGRPASPVRCLASAPGTRSGAGTARLRPCRSSRRDRSA